MKLSQILMPVGIASLAYAQKHDDDETGSLEVEPKEWTSIQGLLQHNWTLPACQRGDRWDEFEKKHPTCGPSESIFRGNWSSTIGKRGIQKRCINYGEPRAWKGKPWLRPDEYDEDWFALDFEVCRNSIPMTDLEGCTIFRSLEWLMYSIIHTASQISSTTKEVIFTDPGNQRGPVTMLLRAIFLWTEILRDAKTSLEATKVLSLEQQLRLVPCYLDYTYQTAAFLEAMEKQGGDLRPEDPMRCLVFDKMEVLYLTYTTMAEQMHGDDPAVRRLFDDRFPVNMPSWWHSKYEVPVANTSIAEYVRRNDFPVKGVDSPFRQMQFAWRCVDDRRQAPANYPIKWEKWNKEGRVTRKTWLKKLKKDRKKNEDKQWKNTRYMWKDMHNPTVGS